MNNPTIIGNGQLANVFKNLDLSNVVIFASGVSDSNCIDKKQFEREKILLLKTIKKNSNKIIVYFSSCVLSAPRYKKNTYYIHKENMEELIKKYSKKYYIFRMPQLFGKLQNHKTLINFLYESIKYQKKFQIYDEAYRYVIEINDVRIIVEEFINNSKTNITVDIANPFRYKVIDIVSAFEELLDKKALYDIIKKEDKYILDLTELISFINKNSINVNFDRDYLKNHLASKLMTKMIN